MHNFVVSAGRAGSTFLAKALNLHPDVFCLVESHHLPLHVRAFGTDRATPRAHLAVLMTARFHTGQPIVEWNLSRLKIPDQVWFDWTQDLMKAHDRMTVAEFQTEFEQFWLTQSGKSIFVDKTPCYGLALGEIKGALGDIRAVHLVRDALPSIKSMAGHPGFRLKVRAHAVSWTEVLCHRNFRALDDSTALTDAEMVDMARLWAARTGGPIREAQRIGLDLTVLRYEDMLADPAKFFAHLAAGLGIEDKGGWSQSATQSLAPSKTPVSYDDQPKFAALRDLPEVREVREICNYC